MNQKKESFNVPKVKQMKSKAHPRVIIDSVKVSSHAFETSLAVKKQPRTRNSAKIFVFFFGLRAKLVLSGIYCN